LSRGLSRQQLQILGLAVAVSRLRYGSPRAHVPRDTPGWNVPIVNGRPYDIHGALASHVLSGARWLPDNANGSTHSTVHQDTSPAAMSARKSASRAIETLRKRGLLAYCLIGRWWDSGYLLTTAGLATGLLHELRVPDLERRLWLLRIPAHKQKREEWNVLEPLSSPAFSLRSDSDESDVTYSGSMKPYDPTRDPDIDGTILTKAIAAIA